MNSFPCKNFQTRRLHKNVHHNADHDGELKHSLCFDFLKLKPFDAHIPIIEILSLAGFSGRSHFQFPMLVFIFD